MHYYLDAYNLLFSLTTETSSLESDREWLINMIISLTAPRNLKVTLVFDGSSDTGYPRKLSNQHVEIIYTTGGESADSYILEKLNTCKHRSLITVVTNDRGLGRLVRHLGGKTQSVHGFMQVQQKKRRKKQHFAEPYLPPIADHTSYFSEAERYLEIFQERFQEIESKILTKSKKYRQWLDTYEEKNDE